MECHGSNIDDSRIICVRIGQHEPMGRELYTNGFQVIIGIKWPGHDPARVCIKNNMPGSHLVRYIKLENFSCLGCDICSELPYHIDFGNGVSGTIRATDCGDNKVIVFLD